MAAIGSWEDCTYGARVVLSGAMSLACRQLLQHRGTERRQISQARRNADAVGAPSFAERRMRPDAASKRRKSFLESLGCFETEVENFHEIDLQPSCSSVLAARPC